MTVAWLETYHGCSCQQAALKKRELVGYCGVHGGDREECLKLPFNTKAEAVAFVNANGEDE